MNLQPGTELDANVAEFIFGLRIDERKASTKVVWNKEEKWSWLEPYSTTWDGMKLVVEEMQRRGCGEVNIKKYEGMGGWRWAARFGKQGFEVAETLPHAVCIAALSALEGKADD